MRYSSLIKAFKNNPPSSVEPRSWSRMAEEHARQGVCVQCGQAPATPTSFRCCGCESSDTIEDIRHEINRIKSSLVKS